MSTEGERAVAKVIADAETVEPEPPRPLRRELPPPEPFPIAALGRVLCDAARAIHEKVQAPLAICANSVLATAALATQGHANVELPTRQARPLSEYFITIAESGERKTSADAEALEPIVKHEQKLRAEYEAEHPGFVNAKEAWTKQRDQILRNKKEYPDQSAKRQALDLLGSAPQPPLTPVLVCPEPTIEGLERLFITGQPALGLFSGEGGQFLGGYAMREETKLHTSTALCSMWDGSPIRRVRAGDGCIVLPGRRLTIHLMLQPQVASLLLSDRLLAGQGLLSRLLISAPLPASGNRFWRQTSEEAELALRSYASSLRAVLETRLPLVEGKLNELEPQRLGMSWDALRTWIGFFNHVEREIRPGGSLEPVRGFANKLPEHAARIAAVLSLIGDLSSPEIDLESMDAGIEIAQHYTGEALRLFHTASARPEIVRAEQLLNWLSQFEIGSAVSLPQIYQNGPPVIRDKKTAAEAVSVLEDHGWLIRIPGGAVINGDRRKEAWRLAGALK
jgi:Protein of unknown function (DUF3987)